MNIEGGKWWRTRDGRKVWVCADRKPGEYPLIGWFEAGEIRSWTLDGFFHKEFAFHAADLIAPWVEPVEFEVECEAGVDKGEPCLLVLDPRITPGETYVVSVKEKVS